MKRTTALLLALPLVAAAQSTLKIERAAWSAKGNTISPELVGFNLLYWIDDRAQFESGTLAREIDGIKPGLLRYPAGTASQNYDWRSNSIINPRLFPFNPTNELLTTDGYIETVKQSGAGGLVVVDIASAHLKDRAKAVNRGQKGYVVAQPVSGADEQAMVDKAVAWARHFKAQGFSPAAYELGNEHYLAFLDYMVFTPEMYAGKCKRFIAAIRAVDPGARFAVGGPEEFHGTHSHYRETEWWPVVLKELAADVERIVIHKYWNPARIKGDTTKEYGAFRTELAAWGAKEGIRTDHLKIGFTEWGGRGHMDAATFGLFSFRMLSGLATEGIDYAVQWPFRWGEDKTDEFGDVQLIRRNDGTPTFAYHVFSAWSRFFSGGRVVAHAATLPQGVHAFAATGKQGAPILALSNEGDAAQSVDLDVAWPENTQAVEIHEITAAGVRQAGSKNAAQLKSILVQPGTILLLEAH